MLRWLANGGTVVLLRSLLVAALICLAVLPAKAYLAERTLLEFSAEALKADLGEMIPWFGAVFAGAYAAFYSRFAAQWSYLASLYNQMMAICVTSPPGSLRTQAYVNWQAAFVEDALELHLARKPMFSTAIKQMLKDPNIVHAFCSSTDRGNERLRELELALKFKAAEPSPLIASSHAPDAAGPGSAATNV